MILANMLGWARPARIVANSSRVASTDLSIFWSPSPRMSLITAAPRRPCSSSGPSACADECPDLLTLHDLHQRALFLGAEDDQRHVVLHAERERRGVRGLEARQQDLLVGDGVELRGARVQLGIGAVEAVDALLG